MCTTELAEVARLEPEFARRGVKVIGLSANDVASHLAWIDDINDIGGNILGSTLDKPGEQRLVRILSDNPLGQGHQSTPLGVIRAA